MIVYASVLIAALMAEGSTRHALLHSMVPLSAPAYVRDEVKRHAGAIAKRAGLPRAVIAEAIVELLARIQIVPNAAYSATLDEARRLCNEAKADGDEDCVALSLASGEPIWSLDSDFDRIEGIRRMTTSDVRNAGKERREPP